MKVLLACLVDDYGNPARGVSFEYYNLYLPLQTVADEVVLFDFHRLLREHGRERMNQALVETVRRERPDVAIFALFTDEFLPDAVVEAGRHAVTVAYFFDDNWRREYTAAWAPRFHYFTTPRMPTYRRYRAAGIGNVVFSPFGVNHALYDRRPVPLTYDVSFVGGHHPWRGFVIERLRRAGIHVAAFGPFWPGGKLEQDAMIDVFCGSRINLNLSNSRQWDVRYLLSSWRALRTTLRSPKDREQIKARHFEIPACGGFQLTYYCEDLERHFVIGDEVEIYVDLDDLIDKIRFYLTHDAERARIAAAGYERARRDHAAARRLRELLAAVVAPSEAAAERRSDGSDA